MEKLPARIGTSRREQVVAERWQSKDKCMHVHMQHMSEGEQLLWKRFAHVLKWPMVAKYTKILIFVGILRGQDTQAETSGGHADVRERQASREQKWGAEGESMERRSGPPWSEVQSMRRRTMWSSVSATAVWQTCRSRPRVTTEATVVCRRVLWEKRAGKRVASGSQSIHLSSQKDVERPSTTATLVMAW
nr:uncharacterized protein LOC127319198 [Lolium perenne]